MTCPEFVMSVDCPLREPQEIDVTTPPPLTGAETGADDD